MTSPIIDDQYGVLSVIRALLGAVTPNLRAVTLKIDQKELVVKVCFFYHGAISDEDFDTAHAALTEIISDFPDNYDLDDKVIRLDYPNPIPVDGRPVFRRKEKPTL